MKILLTVSEEHGDGEVVAFRRVERKNYRGLTKAWGSREELREAVAQAVQSLDERHGRQIGMRVAQVPPGGQK